MYSFFALVSRLKNISRWSLMRNTNPENVSEHSHMTAVLAHALAVIRRDALGIECDPGAVAAAGLYHDASEVMTGDMPTPVKYLNSAITSAYKGAESAARDKLLSRLPENMRETYNPLLDGGKDDTEKAIVHAADKLSAYIKCVEELRAGNNEFRLAAKQTKEKLTALKMPEVDYFLEHFMPAFELTIDEISE